MHSVFLVFLAMICWTDGGLETQGALFFVFLMIFENSKLLHLSFMTLMLCISNEQSHSAHKKWGLDLETMATDKLSRLYFCSMRNIQISRRAQERGKMFFLGSLSNSFLLDPSFFSRPSFLKPPRGAFWAELKMRIFCFFKKIESTYFFQTHSL